MAPRIILGPIIGFRFSILSSSVGSFVGEGILTNLSLMGAPSCAIERFSVQ